MTTSVVWCGEIHMWMVYVVYVFVHVLVCKCVCLNAHACLSVCLFVWQPEIGNKYLFITLYFVLRLSLAESESHHLDKTS